MLPVLFCQQGYIFSFMVEVHEKLVLVSIPEIWGTFPFTDNFGDLIFHIEGFYCFILGS